MTNDRINDIRARCEAATPGPWKVVEGKSFGVQSESKNIASCFRTENEQFIAHSREDIPFLLAEIDRLTEAQRWIPVSEKPRRTQNCLCLFNDGSMAIAWYNGVPYEFHPDITHWMPLPAAPKGDSRA